MRGTTRLIDSVLIDDRASPDDIAAVEKAFTRSGLSAKVEPGYPLSGGAALPVDWVVHVALAAPIAAFFAAFGAEAGKDAYAAFKRWFRDVSDARKPTSENGQIILYALVEETAVVLHAQTSDDALAALREVNWPAIRGGHVVWDAERRTWRDEVAEQGEDRA